jgi:hypothetical protein
VLAFSVQIGVVASVWRIMSSMSWIKKLDERERTSRRAKAGGRTMLMVDRETMVVDSSEADEFVREQREKQTMPRFPVLD